MEASTTPGRPATCRPMPSTSSAIRTASYSTSRLTAGTAPGADGREKGEKGSGEAGIFLRPPRCRKFCTIIRKYSTDYSEERNRVFRLPRSLVTASPIVTRPSHNDVSTTMIYTRVLNRGAKGVFSPADRL